MTVEYTLLALAVPALLAAAGFARLDPPADPPDAGHSGQDAG